MFRLVSVFIGASLLSACFGINTATGGGHMASPRVTGTLTYLERVALPPTTVVKEQLVDLSRADAPAVTLGEQIIPMGGKQLPFFFEISYEDYGDKRHEKIQ
jgi:putative lipoprotein